MPEFFLELFSEEIPARMQARAADDLNRLLAEALAALAPTNLSAFSGPRRIAVTAAIDAAVPAKSSVERGPRRNAPEQALTGFLRKHGAERAQLREEGDFWVLEKCVAGSDAAALVAQAIPSLLRRFPWPKSMRWGGTSGFTWVRPLRRILCVIDGNVVHFDLRTGTDDGHGLESSNVTEGHRFLSPGRFKVESCADWQATLLAHHVIADAGERKRIIADGLRDLAATRGLAVVADAGLLDEVTGLVEWPVPLIGAIDAAYMDLPPEVLQVSMRVNQRYFALQDALGRPSPHFAFVANMAAPDHGATIIAGNERVLRARFSDARHFWDLDRTRRLESRVAALDHVTFHARLGSQGDRVRRLVQLAETVAPFVGADPVLARRTAFLAKADLTTGMVGEFPELQGVMGGYYALHDGEARAVAEAIHDHYAPKGPSDSVPRGPVGLTVALADKLDQLAGFFVIGEKPTGSGDPYALRRAALGIIRIIREGRLRLRLLEVFDAALEPFSGQDLQQADPLQADLAASSGLVEAVALAGHMNSALSGELLNFLLDRLRVQLKNEGARHDVLNAALGSGIDDDLERLLARTDAVAGMLDSDDGRNLLAAARRAANILRIEEKKDGPHARPVDPSLLGLPEEIALAAMLDRVTRAVTGAVANEEFTAAMTSLASLRAPLDAYFEKVTVNDPQPELRRNRLALLAAVRGAMNLAADFSQIEG